MYTAFAEGLLILLGVYLGVGLLFAIPFLIKGVARIDPTAQGSSFGFRLIIAPGVIALWPLLARRWLGGNTSPPLENNAHRSAACALQANCQKEGSP